MSIIVRLTNRNVESSHSSMSLLARQPWKELTRASTLPTAAFTLVMNAHDPMLLVGVLLRVHAGMMARRSSSPRRC